MLLLVTALNAAFGCLLFLLFGLDAVSIDAARLVDLWRAHFAPLAAAVAAPSPLGMGMDTKGTEEEGGDEEYSHHGMTGFEESPHLQSRLRRGRSVWADPDESTSAAATPTVS